MKNKNLSKAKAAKNDEFYTQLTDIEKELKHYRDKFRGKIIFCNCDDPEESNFWLFFKLNFDFFGLKKLISTHYDAEKPTYKLEMTDMNTIVKTDLKQNGDFRSEECIELLKECDMVVSNPPFSCYSDDTEVMTDKGWKFIKDVKIDNDLIYSVNPQTQHMEFVKAVDFIEQKVDDELLHFNTPRTFDLLVTKNHKMFAYSPKKNKLLLDKNGNLPEASQIKPTHRMPLNNYTCAGEYKKYFTLPACEQLEQCSRRPIVKAALEIPMNSWLEFFGFYLADGSCRVTKNSQGNDRTVVSIKQSNDNVEYVVNLCKSIGFIPKIYNNGTTSNIEINSKQLWLYLKQFGKSESKYIPTEFLNLDNDLLKSLLKGYKNGDSYFSANAINFSSKSRQLMLDIQYLILRLYGNIVNVNQVNSIYKGEPYTYFALRLQENRKHREFAKYQKPERVPYSRKVYCLTLERNHVMLVKRGLKIAFSGNCFRDFLAQLTEHNKQFIIVGNKNAITYKETFKLIKDNKLWLGYGSCDEFMTPDGTITKSVKGLCRWFTNVDHKKRKEDIFLYKRYYDDPSLYPKYDNYAAINVDKVKDIPEDYDGVMGVPITFLDKYNPEQFEIVGMGQGDLYREVAEYGVSAKFVENYYKSGQTGRIKENHPVLVYYNQKKYPVIPYMRILIKKRKD